ncbi:unnamed protein product [Rhodiola kirilowii]
MSYDHYGYPRMMSFEQSYTCSSVSTINRPQLENGDKIIMPASALYHLALMQIDYPMLFELRNMDRVSHCGVLEFVADEGMVHMPQWMMNNLELQEGDVFKLKNVSLPKGSFIKLQPHSSDFLEISNPKAVLETSLRSFTCLTTGDTFMVLYNDMKYYIDVVETRPDYAVSVVETDCEVDFAAPLDYKEPEKPAVKEESVQEAQELSVSELRPFAGTGRRLDGKQVEEARSGQPVEVTASSPSNSSSASSRRTRGKVVFGSTESSGNNTVKGANEPVKETNQKPEKKEEPKFQPFTGKAYSLQ